MNNEQQVVRARMENRFLDEGVLPDVSEYDDHEVHVAEHEADMKRAPTEVLRALYAEHLRHHMKLRGR